MNEVSEDTPCNNSLLFIKVIELSICPLCESTCHSLNRFVDIMREYPIAAAFPELCQGKFKQGENCAAGDFFPLCRRRYCLQRIFGNYLCNALLKVNPYNLCRLLNDVDDFLICEGRGNINQGMPEPPGERFVAYQTTVEIVSHCQDDRQ